MTGTTGTIQWVHAMRFLVVSLAALNIAALGTLVVAVLPHWRGSRVARHHAMFGIGVCGLLAVTASRIYVDRTISVRWWAVLALDLLLIVANMKADHKALRRRIELEEHPPPPPAPVKKPRAARPRKPKEGST